MDHSTGKEYYKHVSSFLRCKKDFDYITRFMESDFIPQCNTINRIVSDGFAFVDPCQKIIQYVTYMQKSSYKKDYEIDDCRYLNYYINEKVNRAYDTFLTEDNYNTFINEFISKYSVLNICKDNMKYIQKPIVHNVKKILDMYIKLDNVISASVINQDNVCSSATECLGTYKSFESDCKEGGHNNELCNALESFRNYIDKSPVKNCNDITFPSFIAQEKTSKLEGAHNRDDSSQMSDTLGEEDSGLNSSKSKTITAISTTLLLFPSLFSLYKVYKEFLSKQKNGSFIRPYIQRNEKVQYNANDEMLQLYLPNYKPQDNLVKEQINVPYQS